MRKIQVKPVKTFVLLNDSLTQRLFGSRLGVKANQSRQGIKVVDCKKGAKRIFSVLNVKNNAPVDIVLNEFDRAVCDAVISELAAGNKYFTPAMIYRDLGGNAKRPIPAAIKKLIVFSLQKLNDLNISLDMSETAKKTSYDVKSLRAGSPLNVSVEEISLNGAALIALRIDGALLFDIASEKKHIIRLAMESVDLAIKHTPRVIAVQHYIIRRVAQILGSNSSANKGKKNQRLAAKLTFANLERCCGFYNLNRWQRQDVRETVTLILDAFKEKNLLTDWNFEKSATGEIRAVALELPHFICELNINGYSV